ncbi:HU family DNA-binding protein [Prevotella falsenii]|uniref:HU family DNA-binding protein n=1 Tax=Prevotella falsenii TaxID=515414 RepID=UPI0004693474|nr:HU family DNA-binding protein [Prevotella falsenii]
MIEFEVRSKKMTIGKNKGNTVYYAYPKAKQNLTNKMVIDRIVRETSLSAGDVSNALISLGAIVRDALLMGTSVDLADLGSFRVVVSSKMIEKEIDVCAETLKKPRIVFTPKAQMREAAKNVELNVFNPKRRKKKESGKPSGEGGGSQHP